MQERVWLSKEAQMAHNIEDLQEQASELEAQRQSMDATLRQTVQVRLHVLCQHTSSKFEPLPNADHEKPILSPSPGSAATRYEIKRAGNAREASSCRMLRRSCRDCKHHGTQLQKKSSS